MKFQKLFDPDSPVFNVVGFPEALFPDGVPDDMQEQIKSEFYDYDIALAPPWVWVERFHYLIKRHLYQWTKLIDSEQALRDDDAIYNYDLNEESTSSSHSATTSTGNGTTNQFVSDTPDGSLDDIANYMSTGARETGTNTGTSEGSVSGSATLRRYGNIGVMTSAQIIGGYRDAMDYDAYRVIFRDLEPLFIGSHDLDDVGEFDRTVSPW